MDTDEFWAVIAAARADTAPERPFHQALVDRLSALGGPGVLAYEECFDRLHGRLLRWDVWAAAYLIGGGCSDDSFTDFRAGLIALGREWYERAVEAPDSLAEHPVVLAAAAAGGDGAVFYEEAGYAAAHAYARLTEDGGRFAEAYARHRAARPSLPGPDLGEDFDFGDPAEMHRRLPRLAALFPGPVDGPTGSAGCAGR
ncbi:DUF4240 domain-containing protein [Kitasatospora sp. NPDC101157]|uniref:DUF4240 domain-containing protein n=1 Tax=Kitasatospora sp. NPDC101157 TaxID=3364098 RepID=UPI00380566A0